MKSNLKAFLSVPKEPQLVILKDLIRQWPVITKVLHLPSPPQPNSPIKASSMLPGEKVSLYSIYLVATVSKENVLRIKRLSL